MLKFSPRSVSAHEANPLSVSKYNVEIRATDQVTVLAAGQFDADSSGNTTLPLGDPGGLIVVGMVGTSIRVYVRQVGPSGELSDFQPVGDADGHGVFQVFERPDGAETVVVNV